MSAWTGKLYLITRADLPPGQQAVQAAHALAEFGIRYPGAFHQWHGESNTLVMLVVEDEDELMKLWSNANRLAEREAAKDRLVFPIGALFQEPDRNNEATAIAFAPSREFERLCRKLPLALTGRMVREACGVTESERAKGYCCTSSRCAICKAFEHP